MSMGDFCGSISALILCRLLLLVRFSAWCIDEGYERAVEAYKEKMEQQLREASLLQEAIEEELGGKDCKCTSTQGTIP